MISKKAAQIVAWSVAGVVLVGAVGYYNFVDKPLASGVEVGDICPDFTVQTYKKEDGKYVTGGEEFTLFDYGGKIVIINFWATYCGPCIAELPEFDQFQKDYAEDVQVITLDGEISESYDSLCEWINTNEKSAAWKDFDITFGWYEKDENDVYNQLGFTSGLLPGTMIVNREGVIIYSQDGSMDYDDLKTIIEPYLKY